MSGLERAERGREQIVVLVALETKERLRRGAAFERKSLTQLLEALAPKFEAGTLAKLRPGQQALYMSGRLDAGKVFGWRQRPAQRPRDMPRVPLSCDVLIETKRQLDRYCRFYHFSLNNVIDTFSKNWEKGLRSELTPEQDALFMAGRLTRRDLPPRDDAPDPGDDPPPDPTPVLAPPANANGGGGG
jgi:hypothetical protein